MERQERLASSARHWEKLDTIPTLPLDVPTPDHNEQSIARR